MRILDLEQAEDEILFALRNKVAETQPLHVIRRERQDRPRLPLNTNDHDLEAAIDDMIERFPETLKYLAK